MECSPCGRRSDKTVGRYDMKKLLTLMLAAGMTLAAANGASAVDVKISGTYDFSFSGSDNLNGGNSFMDDADYRHNTGRELNQHHFDVYQRLRLGMDFVMSEQLSAFYQAQVGIFNWGGSYKGASKMENDGGALGTRASNITTRLAYLDWMIPQTNVHVRMGQQEVLLPNYVAGSPVLDDPATGVFISAPVTDTFSANAFWMRAVSDPLKNAYGEYDYDNADVDLFGLIGDLKYDYFRLTPWGMIGHGGSNFDEASNVGSTPSGILPFNGMNRLSWDNGTLVSTPDGSDSTIWFAGLGGEFTFFDPLRLALDFYYSGTRNDNASTEREGWYVAALAEYRLPWFVPAVKAWYASGDDSKVTNGSEQPLYLSGGFKPGASSYFKGRFNIANTIDNGSAGGTWGVSAQLNRISFIEDLSHDRRVTYFRGTNSSNMPNIINNVYGGSVTPADYLTTKDHVVEVDFDTSYQIYKNFVSVLELSYAFQDFDGGVWKNAAGEGGDFSNAWRAALNFRYKF